MNRFKGLDLVDRVPEELMMEVHSSIQEVVTEIPAIKKWKNAKWLPEKALHISGERREVKGKGEKEKIHSTECRVPENSKER